MMLPQLLRSRILSVLILHHQRCALYQLFFRRTSLHSTQTGQCIPCSRPNHLQQLQITMGPINRRLAANRFSPLDTDVGSQHTVNGMTQDVYELQSGLPSPVVLSPTRNSLGSPKKHPIANINSLAGYQSQPVNLDPPHIDSVRYSLEFLLQLRTDPRRQQYVPAEPILAGLNLDPRAGPGVDPEPATAHNDTGVSLDAPEEPASNGTFPYSRLPFELRQMVLRELVPTKSIWNGTSFPKSCQYHSSPATIPRSLCLRKFQNVSLQEP